MNGKKIISYKKTAVYVAIAFAVLFVVIAPPVNARAAASTVPTAVNVTYYDGIYTRGWAWRTDRTVSDGQVWIIEKTGGIVKSGINWNDSAVIKIDAFGADSPSGAIGDTSLYTVWKAHYDFTSAAAGKTYFYKAGSPTAANGWSPVGEQKIAGGSDSLKLICVTDPQGTVESHYEDWNQTLKSAYKTHPDAQAVLATGDLVDTANNMNEWNWLLNKPQSIFSDTVFMPLTGNHNQADAFFESHFNINYSQTVGNYSFNVQNVHITVLENASIYSHEPPYTTTNKLSQEQLDWLDDDLTKADADWKIVAMHIPIVSSGGHFACGYIINLRQQLFPIFAKHKVDLVLQGHDHTYTRSKPYSFDNADLADEETGLISNLNSLTVSSGYQTQVIGGKQYSVQPEGTTYITGCSAVQALTRPAYDTSALSYLHFAQSPVNGLTMGIQPGTAMFGALAVDGAGLMYQSYTVSGGVASLYDYFGIVKELPSKTASQIDALPDVFSNFDAGAIIAAYDAYQALSSVNKEQISSALTDKLMGLYSKINIPAYNAAKPVIELLAGMDTANLIFGSELKARLDGIAAQYGALSVDARAYIDYGVFETAAAWYNDNEAANAVDTLIQKIFSAPDSGRAAAIAAARTAYDALTERQKSFVNRLSWLLQAEQGQFPDDGGAAKEEDKKSGRSCASKAHFTIIAVIAAASLLFFKKRTA